MPEAPDNEIVDPQHTQPEIGYALEAALKLAAAGGKIVPVPAGHKYPKGFGKWQDIATDDPDQIVQWLDSTTHGIGWAMGRQPDGSFLVAVDVDGDEGMEQLFELIRLNGNDAEAFLSTVSQNTGSGKGCHFVFETDIELSNGRLAPKIDTRGEGGFIVVGPTLHPTTGDPYVWAKMPWENRPLPLPEWVKLILQPVERQTTSVPRGTGGDSPADWVRENLGIAEMLSQSGWSYTENKGQDSYWCRPGKEPRDGHSAVLHGDGPLVVFSTAVPEEFNRVGRDNHDGSRSLSPAEVYAAVTTAGDFSAAMSSVRTNLMPKTASPPSAGTGDSTKEDHHEPQVETAVSLNLPDSFWEARPVLSKIKQAAWSRMESPDAVLGAMISRYSTCIPPQYRIPAIVGSPATFDHLSVIVGKSGSGKSNTMTIAEELFPGPDYKSIVWGLPNPNGEGLVASFYEEVTEEVDGKNRIVFKKTKDAVQFSVDEGMALVQAGAQRSGTTIASVLCAAWSGHNPGQGNASKERRRIDLKRWTFRMSGVVGIQLSLGYHLLSDEWIAQGLSGRLVFFSATDESIPFDGPEFPGELHLPIHPTTSVTLEYHPDIKMAVRKARHAVVSGSVVLPPIDGHRNLLRLKLAGILALWENRTTVDLEDWSLAGEIVSSSSRIRDHMESVASEYRHQQNVTNATASGQYAALTEEAKEKVYLERAVRQIPLRLKGEKKGLRRNELRRRLSSGPVKKQVDEALSLLSASSQIRKSGDHWFLS